MVSVQRTFAVTLNGVNDTPTLQPVPGPTYTDTPTTDNFAAVTGTLQGADVDRPAETLTYGIVGGAPDTSLSGYNQSLTGTYGTLYLNTATGAYTFVPNDIAINALRASTNESFTVTVSDGALTAQQNFTVLFDGAFENQAITIRIADTQTSIGEEAGGTDTFTITLSEAIAAGNTVTVDVTFGGDAEDADFVTAPRAALQAVADATAGVSFDGTTLTFDDTFDGTTLSFSVTAADDDASIPRRP